MKHFKAAELKSKTVTELEEMVRQERADLFKARRDLVFRQLTDTASLKIRRHNIARVLTVIAEKQKEGKA
ncbi:MAG: 50S ribosomal protein L29 [Fimbriimonadaceae bacterium]|nr:50S ribosomal protein L29 [Fimbriimonadaceae bacterium]